VSVADEETERIVKMELTFLLCLSCYPWSDLAPQNSRFTVDVSEIKKTFEILIDKEYMERIEGQRGMYRYLA
jgi:hypothetical protein